MTTPRSWALFGKLPAHGDFVRRGDPMLVQRLDAWLTLEVERLARGRGDALDAALSELPTWGFVLPDGLAGALSASHDRVGRVFPLVACATGGRAVARDVATLIERAEAEMLDVDAIASGLNGAHGIDGSAVAEPDPPGWWLSSADVSHHLAITGLPSGTSFDRLFDAPDQRDEF